MAIELEPINALERALTAAQSGKLPVKALYGVMLAEKLSIPSATEVQPDGRGLTPLTYEREGVTRVAVFSEPGRAARLQQSASYLLEVSGLTFIKGFPKDLGLVINPGYTVGLEMTPEAVQALIVAFA